MFVKKDTDEIEFMKGIKYVERYEIKDMECVERTYINRQHVNSEKQQSISYYVYAPT